MTDRKYWKYCWQLCRTLLFEKIYLKKSELPDEYWTELSERIGNIISGNNFLLLAILAMDRKKVDRVFFYNFLFYFAIRTRKAFKAFKEDPDWVGKGMLAPIYPEDMPDLSKYYIEKEISKMIDKNEVDRMLKEIQNSKLEKLLELFPKTYKNMNIRRIAFNWPWDQEE